MRFHWLTGATSFRETAAKRGQTGVTCCNLTYFSRLHWIGVWKGSLDSLAETLEFFPLLHRIRVLFPVLHRILPPAGGAKKGSLAVIPFRSYTGNHTACR